MKIAIRYYTRSGNTQKLAASIADAVGAEALDVSVPLTEQVDLLFLGSAVYAAGVDDAVNVFLRANASKIGMLVNFSTAALLPSTYKQIKKLAMENNIPISEWEFHCRGAFSVMHRGRPNGEDQVRAAAFALEVMKTFEEN